MIHFRQPKLITLFLLSAALRLGSNALADVGVGAPPVPGAEVILDGSRKMLDEKWIYWEGPGFKSSMPIKWKIVEDPVDAGATAVMTDDRAADGGKFGAADIVTKKQYHDFRLHIEFAIMKPRGNSGVYLQNRYEIQIMEGDKTKHGLGAVINESESPYFAFNGLGKWNAYDINFRAARFENGKRTEPAMVTMYFNGQKVHTNQPIMQVWGGPNSGIDGGNDGGKGITDTPGGIKLQCEGHDVRYRNAWIKEVKLDKADTDFTEPVVSGQAAISKEKRQEIERMLRLTGMEKLVNTMLGQMISSYRSQIKEVPSEFWNRMEQKLTAHDLIEKVVPLYDKYYSLDDLRTVNAFYETAVGQKVMATLPQITQESMKIGQEWGAKIGQQIATEAEAEIKKKKAE